MLLKRGEGPLNPLLLRVAVEVREEHVGPGALAARAALYAGQVDALLGEGRERVAEHPGPILDREDDAPLVPPRPRGPRAAQHDKARGVGEGVLDAPGEDVQAVRLSGQDAPDGCHPRLTGGAAGRLRSRTYLLQAHAGELVAQPGRRLGEGHGVRADDLRPL